MKTLLTALILLSSIILTGCNSAPETTKEKMAIQYVVDQINDQAQETIGKKARFLIKLCTQDFDAKVLTVQDMNEKCYMDTFGYSSSEARFDFSGNNGEFLKFNSDAVLQFIREQSNNA